MNSSIPIHIAHDLYEFKQTLSDLFASHTYSTCYMSLGSKQNEYTTQFSYPENIRDRHIKSNAEYQMFPDYLRNYFPEKQGLIIVIDHFSSETSSIHLLNQVIQSSNKNMDIILFDVFVTTDSIQEITRSVLAMLDNIPPTSYLFANFLCFRNTPNNREMQLEQNIPKMIQNVLNQEHEGKYKNCLYQWYGYTYYQYHYIYCYNTYHLFRMMRCNALLQLLKETFGIVQLLPENHHMVFDRIETDLHPKRIHMWNEFLDNTICIISCSELNRTT